MCKQPSSVHFTPQYTETLQTHVRESLQMQSKLQQGTFVLSMKAGDSLTCMLVVTIGRIVVVV